MLLVVAGREEVCTALATEATINFEFYTLSLTVSTGPAGTGAVLVLSMDRLERGATDDAELCAIFRHSESFPYIKYTKCRKEVMPHDAETN